MKKILTGMLALVMVAGAAQAQTKEKHEGKQKHEMVATKLGLTEDQKARLKTIHEARRAELQSLKQDSLTPDQQKEKRKEIARKYHSQIQAVFTPEQKDQMKKMKAERKEKGKKDFRKGGRKAGGSLPGLTEEQKTKMAQLREEFKGQAKAVREDKSLTEEQRKEKMQAIKKEQREKMKSILTKEQLEKIQAAKKSHKEKSGK